MRPATDPIDKHDRPLLMVPGATRLDRCRRGHRDARHFQDAAGWICSVCGQRGPWTDAWGYYGTYECRVCLRAAIVWVACSETCQHQFMAAERAAHAAAWTGVD